MMDKVREYIEEHKMLNVGDRVVLGVSGGADSTALLEIMCRLKAEYRLSLFVVHVNHCIRDEAAKDAMYVRELCDRHGLPFFLFEEDIPAMAADEHMSEEEAGRKCRYRCFYKVMVENAATKLAVAHHLDDQVETVLFHMVRGTDISGLSGMKPVSLMMPFFDIEDEESGSCYSDEDLYIIRPLLNVRRDEITAWLCGMCIEWREDITNSDDSYARNRIRNRVVPELREINDKAAEHIAELSKRAEEYDEYICRQAYSFIENEVRILSENMSCDGKTLVFADKPVIGEDSDNGAYGLMVCREHLLKQDKVIIEKVLYEMLAITAGAKKDIEREHVNILRGLLARQSGSRVNLPYGMSAVVSYEWMRLEKVNNRTEENVSVEMREIKVDDIVSEGTVCMYLSDGCKIIFTVSEYESMPEVDKRMLFGNSENLQKNYTKYFDCGTIGDTLYVRQPKTHDYFICDENGHRKKLSKHFKDIKLPSIERNRQVVLASGSEILWIVGLRRCEAHYVTNYTRRILSVEYVTNKNKAEDD